MLSFSNLYAINAWLLLSPSSLCCDWTLGSIPLVTSLTDPRNLWSVLLYLGLTVLLLHLLLTSSSRDRTAAGMGVAVLLLCFLPASGIVFRVGFVIAERCVTSSVCDIAPTQCTKSPLTCVVAIIGSVVNRAIVIWDQVVLHTTLGKEMRVWSSAHTNFVLLTRPSFHFTEGRHVMYYRWPELSRLQSTFIQS